MKITRVKRNNTRKVSQKTEPSEMLTVWMRALNDYCRSRHNMSFEHTLPYRAKRRSRVCSYLDMTEEGNATGRVSGLLWSSTAVCVKFSPFQNGSEFCFASLFGK